MTASTSTKLILGLYSLAWLPAKPLLKRNSRLSEGYGQRLLQTVPDGPVDVWIQAASGGEAYLARELVLRTPAHKPIRYLLTSNTKQGVDILKQVAQDAMHKVEVAYCPFDQPKLMQKAVEHYAPKAVVLLETELWPGLLAACRKADVPTFVVNARMNTKSFAAYMCAPKLFAELAPHRVMAISDDDARRYSILFGNDRVTRMNNIKFDRVPSGKPTATLKDSPVTAILGGRTPVAVFASVRQEEETDILKAITKLKEMRPKTSIALFPRHMHRLDFWKKALYDSGLPTAVRSEISTAPAPGTVILWDTFGELSAAYEFCRAAFVGGSLKPLGGQNFLEPLSHGIVPVSGPHWSNFAWIGREIVDAGLLKEISTADDLAVTMKNALARPPKPDNVRKRMANYVDPLRGGTEQALNSILNQL